ncbi:MAG: methylamine utilization protein MauG [Campylobacterales bacterium]|nr:methylamine utilization protein MauG [Campylobacterales bacterium]
MNFSASLTLALSTTAIFLLSGCNEGSSSNVPTTAETDLATLGEALFFDTNLSEPTGQSCASCHAPQSGFADPDSNFSTSEGIIAGQFGTRNTPTAAYAAFVPAFAYDIVEGLYTGGQFLDGRASLLEDQAKGPPLNLVEMHNPNKASYVAKVAAASYAPLVKKVFGLNVFEDPEAGYEKIARAIAAYERTKVFSPFSSKFDLYIKGKATLSPQEMEGLTLFEGKGQCVACHPTRPTSDGTPGLFTDFTYDNLGVPKNREIPAYAADANFIDIGLAGNSRVIADGRVAENRGKFKVSTLRNIALTGPYMHNGVFKTLKEVVSFYNTRDTNLSRWDVAEIPETVNHTELGNLGLSDVQEDAIVAFLQTLTDGYGAK